MKDRPGDEQTGADDGWARPAAEGTGDLGALPPPPPGAQPWGAPPSPATPPQGDPFADGYPMIPQHPQWGERPASTRRWTIAAGVLLAVLSVGAVAVMAWRGLASALPTIGSDAPSGAGRVVSIYDLAYGDCFRFDETGDTVADVKVVACDQPHDAQVYGVVDLGLEGAYPGEEAVRAAADAKCEEVEAALSTDVYDEPELFSGMFFPIEATWRTEKRTVRCTVETDVDDGLTRSYLA